MFVFQCLMLGIYRNFQHWCMTVASGSCFSDCVALYIGFWPFQAGSASTRAFSRTMAKEAVLAMSALLKASGHESPSQREGHLETLLSLLASVELSPADAGEVSQELLSDGHDFAPDEVRRIQLQLHGAEADEDDDEQDDSLPALRKTCQDYCRLDRFLTVAQWSALLVPASFRERADRLSEIAFELGCRLPSAASKGYWTALLSWISQEDSPYQLHCNLQTMSSSWKATVKRCKRTLPEHVRDLPSIQGLPSSVDGFPDHILRPQPADLQQRPIAESTLVALAFKVPLRKTRGSISKLASKSQSSSRLDFDDIRSLLNLLRPVQDESTAAGAIPGLKIYAGNSALGKKQAASVSAGQAALQDSTTVRDLEQQLQLRTGAVGEKEQEIVPSRLSAESLPDLCEPQQLETQAKELASNEVLLQADLLEDRLRKVSKQKSAKMPKPAASVRQASQQKSARLPKPAASAAKLAVKKRPAAAPESAPCKRPAAAAGLLDDPKNRASRAYHAARKAAIKAGKSDAEALDAARRAHRKEIAKQC